MKVLKNLIVDVLVFCGFLIAYEPKITGESIHEWLGLALFVTLLFHLFLHWKWVVDKAARFFKKMTFSNRLNFGVDFLFFVAIIGVNLTGIMMSKTALPVLGIALPRGGVWKQLHTLFADASLYLLALHFALHWAWVRSAFKRFVFSPIGRLFKPGHKALPVPVRVEND